jgi:hypothetical protein
MFVKFIYLVGQPYRVSPGPQLPPLCVGDLGAHPFQQRCATKALTYRSRVVAPSQRILIGMPLCGDKKKTKKVILTALRGCAQRKEESCHYGYPAAPRRG